MNQWEYKVIQWDRGQSYTEILDDLGSGGWELVAVLSDGRFSERAFLKRPIEKRPIEKRPIEDDAL